MNGIEIIEKYAPGVLVSRDQSRHTCPEDIGIGVTEEQALLLHLGSYLALDLEDLKEHE